MIRENCLAEELHQSKMQMVTY